MKLEQVTIGQRVEFLPKSPNFGINYSLDGVSVGDTGIVTGIDCGDVLLNFTRQDGSICEGFYAFPEDLEIIK